MLISPGTLDLSPQVLSLHNMAITLMCFSFMELGIPPCGGLPTTDAFAVVSTDHWSLNELNEQTLSMHWAWCIGTYLLFANLSMSSILDRTLVYKLDVSIPDSTLKKNAH